MKESIDPELVDAELASVINGMANGLTDEEATGILERMTGGDVRPALIRALRRIAAFDKPRRLEAERDGWRQIAQHLLGIAFGDDALDSEIPPLELLELRRPADGRVEKYVTALEQFWADLTRKHEERRKSKGGSIQFQLEVDEPVSAGAMVIGGPDGRVRSARDRITLTSANRADTPRDQRARLKKRRGRGLRR